MLTLTAILTKRTLVAPDIYQLELTLDQPLTFAPGQYVLIAPPQGDLPKRPYARAYSIAGYTNHTFTPDGLVSTREISLILGLEPSGVCSGYLIAAPVGEKLAVQGPAGHFKLRATCAPTFLCAGTGIAPVYTMLKALAERDDDILSKSRVIWGLTTTQDVYLIDEITRLISPERLHICFSRESSIGPSERHFQPHIGRMTDHFGTSLTFATDESFYLCGGGAFVQDVRTLLLKMGTSLKNIFFERFS